MNEQRNIPELRFPEFNRDWSKKTLQDTSSKTISYGIVQTGENIDNGVPCVRVVDLTGEDLNPDKMITTTGKISQSYSKTILELDEIMFALRGEIGLVAIVDSRLVNVNLTRGVARISADKETVNPHFLLWFLRSPDCVCDILKRVNGSALQEIPLSELRKVQIKYPSLPEQQKIASFFTAVDKKISQLKQKKTLLEQYKKSVMQKFFSQEIRFRDDNGQEFPKWEKKRLGELIYQISKRNKDDKINLVLSVSNTKGFITQNEQFDNHRVASKDVINYKIVSKGDFAYNPSRINVGSIARLVNYKEGIVSPMYVVFGIKDSLNSVFFENWLTTHIFNHLVKISCSGSVRDSLNFEDMCLFTFMLPTKLEQTKIAKFLSAIDTKINHTQTQIENAERWKKGLLQKMFV